MWNSRWDRVGSHVGCQCDGIEGGVDGPPEIKGNRRTGGHWHICRCTKEGTTDILREREGRSGQL